VLLGLVFCLCVFLVKSKSIHAEEWTAEQKEVAECFQKLCEASFKGIDEMKGFWHPKISWWNYDQEHPVGIDGYVMEMKEFYKQRDNWISIDAKPMEIHVIDNVAILYATYINTFKGSESKSGYWTAVLIKQEGKWLFLSNSYVGREGQNK
jgi:hypothetical protein